jgi:hypothetical protein
MNYQEHLRILKAAEEAGLVRFEGGETETYGIAKASAGDHSKAFWTFASPEKLAKFITALEKETVC